MHVEHRVLRQERVVDQRAEGAEQHLVGSGRGNPLTGLVPS